MASNPFARKIVVCAFTADQLYPNSDNVAMDVNDRDLV